MKGLLLTYLLTYGGALAAIIEPYLGLLIYVAFAIIKPNSLWHWSMSEDGNFSRIVAIALLAGWVFRGFGSWNFGPGRAVTYALLAYLSWATLCAPMAVADTGKSWDQVWEYTKFVLPFVVAMTTIRTVAQLKQLAWVIAICQGYLALEFNRVYYTTPFFNVEDWHFAGLDNNGVAITMVASAGFTFFLGLYSPKLWQKILGLGLAAAMVHVVLFSMSRGGMLALIVSGVTIFVLIPKRSSYVLIALLALAVGVRLAGSSVIERFDTVFSGKVKGESGDVIDDESAQSRLQLWTACFNVMLEHPVTGIGPNNWRQVAHNYGFPKGKDAHTMWLHVGAEQGFPGLLLLITFYATCVRRLWRLRRDFPAHADPWLRQCPDMVIASIIGFAVSAQFVSVHGIELPFYLVLVGAAALKLSALAPAEVGPGEPSPAETATSPIPAPVT